VNIFQFAAIQYILK